MDTISGDVTLAKEDIIVHQVNTKGVMGKGVALSVRREFPEVYDKYKDACRGEVSTDLLGKVLFVNVGDKWIANIFGQGEYGYGKVFTDEEALLAGIRKVREFAEENRYSVALPEKIGSGLGGGDWSSICSRIEEDMEGIEAVWYRYKG